MLTKLNTNLKTKHLFKTIRTLQKANENKPYNLFPNQFNVQLQNREKKLKTIKG